MGARMSVPLRGLGMVAGQAPYDAPHRARARNTLERGVGPCLVLNVGIPGPLVFFRGTSSLVLHHGHEEDASPHQNERLEQSWEEPKHP